MRYSRSSRLRLGPRKVVSVVAGVALVAGLSGGLAKSATTVSPLQPGNFTRENTVNITTNPVAVQFNRNANTATANFVRVSPFSAQCVGDDPNGTNNSPRTTIEVIGPGTIGVVHTAVSPVLRRDIAGALGGFPVLNPQPAPNATNYRGGAHGSTVSGAPSSGNTTRPWTTTANLEGKPGGIYTVRTTTQNMIRTGPSGTPGPCQIGSAVFSGGAWTNQFNLGPIVETSTFEYRPWQHVFTDVMGNGRVQINTTPKEFQAVISTTPPQTSQIWGPSNMSTFSLRSDTGADPTSLMLPSDPEACAADPTSCLPPNVEPCDPTTGCIVRFIVLTQRGPANRVIGVFDTATKAFIATVGVNGYSRVMFSLGTQADAAYHGVLTRLRDQASAQGIDLMTLLTTKVRLSTGSQEFVLSLLNGLQINPASVPAGVQIVSEFTAQAGLILNIYAGLTAPCTTQAGDSNPATPAPDRYTPTSDAGYTVERSDLLPDVPRVGAVGALVGGPIYHIEGDFVTSGSTILNTSTAVIGVDTAAGEPNGYPVWVEPFLSSPANVTAARTMDFIGTATWSASETNLGALGCLSVNFMLGAGVALYNNPLDIGFGDIPIWDPASPAVADLMAQINAAVQGAVDEVTTNPTVADLLEQITDAVLGGGLPTDDLPL